MDFDAGALNVVDIAAKHLSLAVHSLQIDADQTARTYLTVLDYATVLPLRNYVHSSLLEIGECAIGNLDVRINCDSTRGLIRFITDEFAANQVERRLREAHQGRELLFQALRDRLKSQRALTKDYTARIQANDAVHVATNFKFLQRFNACLLSVFDILHSLKDVLKQFDTRVSEGDSFEVDELSLLELDVDNGALVAHDYNLSVFVFLLDGESWLRNGSLACIYTLR